MWLAKKQVQMLKNEVYGPGMHGDFHGEDYDNENVRVSLLAGGRYAFEVTLLLTSFRLCGTNSALSSTTITVLRLRSASVSVASR